MDRNIVLWIVIGILVVLVIYVTFFNGSADNSTLSAGKTAGEVAYSGMVGGC
jgi:hypothetical protein